MRKNNRNFLLLLLFLFFLAALVIVKIDTVSAFISRLLTLLTPLYVGLILAYVLNRPIEFFKKQLGKLKFFKTHSPLALSIVIVYLIFLGLLVGMFFILIPQLSDSIQEFAGNFQNYSEQFSGLIQKLSDTLERYRLDPSILSDLNENLGGLGKDIIGEVPALLRNTISTLFSVVGNIFIGLIVSIYLLIDKKRMLRQVDRLIKAYVPDRREPKLRNVMTTSNEIFSEFVYIQSTESVLLALMVFVTMTIFGFPYALIISVVIGVTTLVPVVGSIVGGAFGILMMLFVDPGKTLWFLLLFIILMQIESNVIYPRRVNNKINLPPVWAILSISVGGGLFGVIGALLAVPVASVIYKLAKQRVLVKEKKIRINKGLPAEITPESPEVTESEPQEGLAQIGERFVDRLRVILHFPKKRDNAGSGEPRSEVPQTVEEKIVDAADKIIVEKETVTEKPESEPERDDSTDQENK